jgi:hypothetical protein
MADDRSPAVRAGKVDRRQRLGQRSDLIQLDQDRVARVLVDRPLYALGIGNQQVVAHQLQAPTESLLERHPARPVVLRQAVLERDDRIPVRPVSPEVDQFPGAQRSAFLRESVDELAVRVGGRIQVDQLRDRWIERNGDLFAGHVARAFDRFEDHLDRGLV